MRVDHVDLKSGGRGHRPVLEMESLTCALSSEPLETKLLSLQLEGWTLDTSCTRLLCQTLKDNNNGNGSNANLVGLTLTNCLWQIELEPDLNLIEALAANTTLKRLVFHNTRVPPSFWHKLPEVLSQPTCSLTQLDLDACVNGEEMSLLLDALCRAPPSLREISVPILFDNWTEELLHKLEALLMTTTSATKKLRKVKFALQAMPSYSLWNKQPENQQRQKVWSVWRNFLASSASSPLQELEASNLSESELLELVDLVAAKKHMEQQNFGAGSTGGIKTLYLNNGQGARLETLTLLLDRLCLCNKTNLKAFLNFTLYNGEELSTRSAARADLARALTGNHVAETLQMTCGVFSPTAGEDLTQLYPEDGRVIHSLLALNRAGRRYMLQDPSNMVKGASVLSQVRQDVDATFHHLKENPSLLCQKGTMMLPAYIEEEVPKERRAGNKRKCCCSECVVGVEGKGVKRLEVKVACCA